MITPKPGGARLLAVAAVASVASLGVVGSAPAQDTSAPKPRSISICVKANPPSKGAMRFARSSRILTPAKPAKCKAGWKNILVGGSTPGPAGPQGAVGSQGATGERGLQGLKGDDGVDGADGANGVDGVDGADGADGADGVDGPSPEPSGALTPKLIMAPAPRGFCRAASA